MSCGRRVRGRKNRVSSPFAAPFINQDSQSKLLHVDDGASVGAGADIDTLSIPRADFIADFLAVDGGDLCMNRDALADAGRREVADVDMGADGLFIGVEMRFGQLGTGALHQADHRWRRKDIRFQLARAHGMGRRVGSSPAEAGG